MAYKQNHPVKLTGCGRRRLSETSPFHKATRKVCLPYSKIKSMSQEERQKIINAKQNAANQGKNKRSSKSNIKDGSTSSNSLEHWVKQDWRQVGDPNKKCGE